MFATCLEVKFSNFPFCTRSMSSSLIKESGTVMRVSEDKDGRVEVYSRSDFPVPCW